MDNYSTYIFKSRYARYLWDEGRRETFEETVNRYISFWGDRFPKENKVLDHLLKAREAMLSMEILGSMRLLMTAGKAAERDHCAAYNCSYLPIDSPRAFDELMYILLCGTGVGFSVERQYVQKLPEIAESFHESGTTIVVSDSKIGWASATRELVALLYSGKIPRWDLSKVRPAGAPLKVFGGRASGPGPLEDLFEFTVRLFRDACGRRLNSLECHDLCCKIASVVVVGGVRRSALISLSNLSDPRMQGAKTGAWYNENPHRSYANNSVCYTESPDTSAFMREWLNLYESRSGERGIFNRVGTRKHIENGGRRDPDHEWGTNPCFSGDMELLTSQGYMRFDALVNKDVVFVVNKNGDVVKSRVWRSGEKELVELRFSVQDKSSIKCTPDHVFMLNDGTDCAAQDLKGKRPMPHIFINEHFDRNPFLAGFILGDGILSDLDNPTKRGITVCFGKDDDEIAQMMDSTGATRFYSREAADIAERYKLPRVVIGKRGFPVENFSKIEARSFVGGLFSANGCVINGHRVALKSTDLDQLTGVQAFLHGYDIASYVTTNKPKVVKFSNGEYLCKESYDLNITQYTSLLRFAEFVSFGQTYKREALKELLLIRAPMVVSVTQIGVKAVFDFHEPKTNWGVVEGCVVHNCSEIQLRPFQFCNLSTIVARPDDNLEDLKRKIRIASFLGTLQSTLTDFRYLRPRWKHNMEEERLLGVSITGMMDHPVLSGTALIDKPMPYSDGSWSRELTDVSLLPEWLEELKREAIETNRKWAGTLGIAPSAAVTTIKPEGTVSQLVNSSSGIHPRYAPYYIRRTQADKLDPLTKYLQVQGVPGEELTTNKDMWVFEWPIKSPEGSVMRDDMSAIDQLEHWLVVADSYTEHNPSITVYVREGEWMEVGAWVQQNFDKMRGVSFLPHTDHVYKQAPYEECTKEEYEKRTVEFPELDWEGFKEEGDYTNPDIECGGGICDV